MHMLDWPTPKSVKMLRGFLRLTGYYRKFVKNYGTIAAPLTNLLKKDQFTWSMEAEQSFQCLQKTMNCTPVLVLPDFTRHFVIECDASGNGIGAMLMQQGQPMAFLSKALTGRALALSTYEKEMMAILHAVTKWRTYLLGRRIRIVTDHRSLKRFFWINE